MAKRKEVAALEDSKQLDYEMVYIVSPELADEALETRIDGISQFITGRDGIVSEIERWGKRKLAYPMGRFLEGIYVLARFKLSPSHCKELEANLNMSEEILRHLLIRVGS